MADKRISQYGDVDMGSIDGSELFEMVQGGVNVKVTLADLYSIFSGGGGGGSLPSGGSKHQMLQLDTDGVTPIWAYDIKDIMDMTAFGVTERTINDSNNNPSVDGSHRWLQDLIGVICYGWQDRMFYDSASTPSLNHDLRYALDYSATEVFSWLNGFQVTSGYPWAFNGNSPTATSGGWAQGTFSDLQSLPNTATATAAQVGNVLETLIGELIRKGILSA